MTFDAISYLTTPRWQTVSLGLSRIKELLAGLGDPQEALRFVHVAGTNGKGSTCAFLASILQQAGYRVGLFTSPALYSFEERIQVDSLPIRSDALRTITKRISEVAEEMKEHPTEFELLTALAFCYFAQKDCDIVVMEVGLGGRLDSTNVIELPEVAVLTPISFDHCELLGETLPQIAEEKAGIIKHAIPVVSAPQDPSAFAVIEQKALEMGAPLIKVDPSRLSGTPECFSYKEYHDLELGLHGSFQLINAATSLEAIKVLARNGWKIADEAIVNGLKEARWPGRFEVVCSDPTIIFDGAHNEAGMRAFLRTLDERYPNSFRIVISGVLADKDYSSMAELLVGSIDQIVAITPQNPRALDAHDYAEVLKSSISEESRTVTVTYADDINTGVLGALELEQEQGASQDGREPIICVCGSLTIQKSVMDVLRQAELAL